MGARFVEVGYDLAQRRPAGAQQLRRLPVSLVPAGVTLHGGLPLRNHGRRKILRAA